MIRNTVVEVVDAPLEEWSLEDEAQLTHLKSGVIESLETTAIYGNALETDNDCLRIRPKTISTSRRSQIISDVVSSLPEPEQEAREHAICGCYHKFLCADSASKVEHAKRNLYSAPIFPSAKPVDIGHTECQQVGHVSHSEMTLHM